MYIFLIFTKNSGMQKLWLFFIGNFIVFFPIFINAESIIDYNLKKIYFTVKFLKISVIGGYITFNGLKVYFHISDKKAFLFDAGDFMKKRKKFFKPEGIIVNSIKTTSFFPVNEIPVVLPEALFVLNGVVCPIIKQKKPYIDIKNDIVFTAQKDMYSVISFCFVINLVTLNLMLVNSILKKAVKYVKGKK